MNLKNLMVLVLSVSLIIGVVVTGACSSKESETKTPGTSIQETAIEIIENITPQTAHTLIQENLGNPDFVILDVRTPEEFAEGHIENAININFYADTFRRDIDKLDKNKTYLVYCRSGSRSLNAAKIMEDYNFNKVYNMLDGIIRWTGEGLPTVK